VALYFSVSLYVSFQRERRLANVIEDLGGSVTWGQWSLPHPLLQEFFGGVFSVGTVSEVNLSEQPIPANLLAELKQCSDITSLRLRGPHVTDQTMHDVAQLDVIPELLLDDTNVTDHGLERLKGMTYLNSLFVRGSPITDEGLVHLQGMTFLEFVQLRDTRTTPEGRAALRKALPNCTVEPSP
jgi:hypothetical protein